MAGFSLKQLAMKANVAEELDTAEFEVFAHGTSASFAAKIVDTQGGCLSASGGKWAGKFFTVPDLAIAMVFAGRTAKNVNERLKVVGLALTQTEVERLKKLRVLSSPPIQGPPPGVPPNTPQFVFEPGALEALRNGFFFMIG